MADSEFSAGDISSLGTPRGRDRESGAIDRLLNDVRRGGSRALMLVGEAGIGKTALLDYARRVAASDFEIARAVGVESEMELPFAALHQLCAPMLQHLPGLPAPQQEALKAAFGLGAGRPPARLVLGVAILSLLSEAAAGNPLLCIVDDAQWLDRESAEALGFVARRLSMESIALLIGARQAGDALQRIETLQVGGLDDPAARELLLSVVQGPLDEHVRERIISDTGGNPLALLELPQGLSPAELAGGFALPNAPLSDRIQSSFLRRTADLSLDAKLLILIASADPIGDALLVLRAAEHLAIDECAASQIAETGLVQLDTRVRFRHPLVRSAIYGAAAPDELRKVHAALATATDPTVDPDRRAWHRAQAAPGPTEEVASELEDSADRAALRGGLAATAAFLERAAMLTPDPERRARRALTAAQAKFAAGAFDRARDLLLTAQSGTLDEAHHARRALLGAQIEFAAGRGRSAAPLLVDAAKRMESVDAEAARWTYLGGLTASMFAGRLANPGGRPRDVAHVVRDRYVAGGAHPAAENLLRGWTEHYSQGFAAGAETLRRGLDAFGHAMAEPEELSLHWLAWITALHLWDSAMWETLAARHVALSRTTGALGELVVALTDSVFVHLFKGEFNIAEALMQQAEAAADATGTRLGPHAALGVAAWRGQQSRLQQIADSAGPDCVRRGEGAGLTVIAWAQANLANALGDHAVALDAAQRATSDDPEEIGSAPWAAVELIEAACRLSRFEDARDAATRLQTIADTTRTDWAIGVNARCQALLADDDRAEDLFRGAIGALERCGIRVELARAHLTFGERLRRQRRRGEAREHLRLAFAMFSQMGASAFAARAARGLVATGAHVRAPEARDDLTAQESQIAQLAESGLSNPEIAARLFISSRTVEYHLTKVFSKLGIRTRRELTGALKCVPGLSLVTPEPIGVPRRAALLRDASGVSHTDPRR